MKEFIPSFFHFFSCYAESNETPKKTNAKENCGGVGRRRESAGVWTGEICLRREVGKSQLLPCF